MFSTLAFACLFASADITNVIGILGGSDVNIERVPYHVNYGDICGGVLVHRKWAITVAHCGTEEDYIRVGSTHRLRGAQIKIKNHFVHPLYQKEHSFDYDIQLLEMYRGLRFGKAVKNIAIGNGECGESIYVSGWGYSEEKGSYNDVLQQVRIELVQLESCQRVDQPWYNGTLTARMFCAGGGERDACQGDSGGGAVSYKRLLGLSSFGYGCGRGIPGVYTNVSHPDITLWMRRYTAL